MDESQKELLRQVRELLEDSARRLCDRIGNASDRIENAIAKCSLAMGGTGSSSTTPACTDIYNNASPPDTNSGVVEVPTPNFCSRDTSFVVAGEAEDLAALTPARCSMEGPCRDSIDMGSPSSPATTTTAATIDLILELTAEPAAPHCSPSPTFCGKDTLDMDQLAPTGFVSTEPMTCSTLCLPQLAIVVPVLDTSSSSTPAKDGLKSNSISVAVEPRALKGVLSVVLSVQLCGDHEPIWPSSRRRISSTVLIHRPRPWPSFVGDHTAGDVTWPLPWPAFKRISDCGSASDAIMKPYQQCTFGGSPLTMGDIVDFHILVHSGNLCTSTGDIVLDMLLPGELRCLREVLWFPQYWWSTSEWRCFNDVLWYFDCWRSTTCMQSAHTPILLRCTISRFQLLVMVRILELKFVSNGSSIFMIVLLDNGAALSSESLVDTTDCVGSLLSVVSLVTGYSEFTVQSISHHSIASQSGSWLLCSVGWMLFAHIRSGQNDSHILQLPCVLEQEEFIWEFQFQQSSTLPDWYLGNQSLMIRVRWPSGTWMPMFRCVRFLVQLEATYSVQTNWLLTYADWGNGSVCLPSPSPTGCSTIHDMCSPDELIHWNDVILLFGYGSACLPSFRTVHTALAWPSCHIFDFNSQTSQLVTVKDSQGMQQVSSFLGVPVDGDQTRPLPWPSFKEASIILQVAVSIEDGNVAAYLNVHAVCVELVETNGPPDYTTADSCEYLVQQLVEHVLSLQYATGLRSLIGLQGSVYFSHSDQSCKSDWKQGRGEFSQAEHSENLALIPLSKLEFDDVASVLCFFRVQGPARMEKSEDISIIKSLQVASALNFGMPVAMDGKVNQHWKLSWDPAGSMFVLCSALLACAPWIRSVAWFWNGLELSTCYLQAHSQGGKNVMSQAIFSDQVEIGHNSYIDKISVGYDYYLDQVFYHDTVYNNLVYYCKDYHHDLDKMKEVHAPWDPGKAALRHPSKTSAWGQADFQEGRNVMTLACVYVFGLVSSWASTDGFGPTDQRGARAATYTTSRGYGKASGWITKLS